MWSLSTPSLQRLSNGAHNEGPRCQRKLVQKLSILSELTNHRPIGYDIAFDSLNVHLYSCFEGEIRISHVVNKWRKNLSRQARRLLQMASNRRPTLYPIWLAAPTEWRLSSLRVNRTNFLCCPIFLLLSPKFISGKWYSLVSAFIWSNLFKDILGAHKR